MRRPAPTATTAPSPTKPAPVPPADEVADLVDAVGTVDTKGRAASTRDDGMATAEYAIATLAACGFAALLLTLLRSAEVRDLLFGIVQRALSIA